MKPKYFEVLSPEEVQAINDATVTILQTIGVRVGSPEARDLFKAHGAEVDDDSTVVKIPEPLLKEQLKHVPDHFTLYGPDGTFKTEVNLTTTQFATIGTPVKIYDKNRASGRPRSTVLKDNENQIRIVDACKNIMGSHVDIWPSDVNVFAVHCYCMLQWAKNTKKHYGLGCLGKVASEDMMHIASRVVGGDDELMKRPRMVGFLNPTSPLEIPHIMINGGFVFAKYKQPIIVAPEALAGSTAPVTLAGLLAQANAEVLATITLLQLSSPGTPVFYGTVSTTTDMRTGNTCLGSIETSLITAGMAQLARFYQIPSRGPGGNTESKVFDVQCGYERLMTMMLAAQAGISYMTCAGTFESTMAESLELLVIDDELASMVKRGLEGIRVDADAIALDVIETIGADPSKNYLASKHTVKNMKKELFIPKLTDRQRRRQWKKAGSLDIIARAGEMVDEILRTQSAPGISPDLEREILDYTKQVEKRGMDEYKQREGISEGVSFLGMDLG